jgi:uncharacterized protein YndB with AHSA1/START domain
LATSPATRQTAPGVTASTQIQASPEAVWSVVSDGNRLPEWLTPITKVRSVATPGALAKGSSVKVKMAGRIPPGQKVAIHEAVPGRKLAARLGPAFAHALGIAMRADLTLEPSGEATTATVGFTCNPITGPLQRKVSGMNLDRHVRATAQRLKEAAEAATNVDTPRN